MGYGRWSTNDWDSYSKTTRNQSTRDIFNGRSMKADMDPRNIKLRESRDSAANPNATPIILALDVTGSMGEIAGNLAREGLGTLVESILDRKPVSDPHIMVMGVGDSSCDQAPLQASQFEPDIRVAEQLKNIYLEGGGGGNRHESYTLPWYFAAEKTDIDCVKHGKKGILFTFGDEECPPELSREHIKKFLGDAIPQNITTAEMLKKVSEKFDVFHVVIEEGDYARREKNRVYESWEKVLPRERIVSVKDYTQLPAILVSVMEVHAGKDPEEVIKSWQGKTVDAVREGIKHAKPGSAARALIPPPPMKLKRPAAGLKIPTPGSSRPPSPGA